MEDRTIFERIRDGEIPAHIVHEGEHFLAFRDVNPQAPVHVLVIPRHKIEGMNQIQQLPPAALAGFMAGIEETAGKLGLGESGYRVVFNTGPDAQQSVAYLHAHILGGRTLGWPPG